MSNLKRFEILLLALLLILLFINVVNLKSFTGMSVSSPSHLSEKEILVYLDKIVIKLENASLARYENSNSMVPVLNNNTIGIKTTPKKEDIDIGDIITFEDDNLVVHRVIEKGEDEEGLYFITKGDNNDREDGKIRFYQIKGKIVGLIY